MKSLNASYIYDAVELRTKIKILVTENWVWPENMLKLFYPFVILFTNLEELWPKISILQQPPHYIWSSETLKLKKLPSAGSPGTSLPEWCNHSLKPLGPRSDGGKYPTNPLYPLAATDRLALCNTSGKITSYN